MKAVIMDNIPLDYGPWLTCSPECLDFLKGLLMRDPAQRMTATEALEHPWFRRHFGKPSALCWFKCMSSAPLRSPEHAKSHGRAFSCLEVALTLETCQKVKGAQVGLPRPRRWENAGLLQRRGRCNSPAMPCIINLLM